MGYIKLDRRMLEWGWFSDPYVSHLWIYILLSANFKGSEWRGETISTGSFPTSLQKISFDTGLSVQTVRRCLKKLQNTGEITIKTTNRWTIISVVKWASYQVCDCDANTQMDTQSAINRTDNGTSNGTNKWTTLEEDKNKEHKKERKEIYKEKKVPTLEEVRSYCLDRGNNVDPQRWFDYYSSIGWTIGKNKKPMKDWKACVRTWERNGYDRPRDNNVDTLPVYSTENNKTMTTAQEEELLRLMKGEA